jgi:RNA polymerase sigma factor (sigma-70 family)
MGQRWPFSRRRPRCPSSVQYNRCRSRYRQAGHEFLDAADGLDRGRIVRYAGRLLLLRLKNKPPPGEVAAWQDIAETAFRAALTVALAELPADQRAVVHLKLWEGLTFEQIAAALNTPPNTAASRYRYGLDKLRERLRPLYEEIK